MKVITLEKVSRSFGRVYALNRVTTRFSAGRLTALLGPNGAGKSTLLTIVATLQAPDRGELRYDDQTQTQLIRGGRQRVGYVSHDALLYGDLSGRENLEFFASLYGVDRARIDTLLERVGMADAAHKLIRACSRGMRQRISIARALLQEPELLVLDEPFSGLDRWGAEELVALLAEEREADRIIVLSTHRLEVLQGVADDIRVLDKGRLIADRPLEPDEPLDAAYTQAVKRKA